MAAIEAVAQVGFVQGAVLHSVGIGRSYLPLAAHWSIGDHEAVGQVLVEMEKEAAFSFLLEEVARLMQCEEAVEIRSHMIQKLSFTLQRIFYHARYSPLKRIRAKNDSVQGPVPPGHS